jgi:alkaline phosphatase D
MRSPHIDRRQLLVLGGGALLAAGAPALAREGPTAAKTPFTLGVASGDPTPDGFVIWTRLAPAPLAADGRGGLDTPVSVLWEIAADETMRQVIRAGRTTADARSAHAVHLEVGGLPSGRPYWYRFTAQGHQSPVGQARSAPAPGDHLERLTVAMATCAHWELGWFSAYRHIAEERPDLVLFLGDYIYEYSYRGDRAKGRTVRAHDRQDEVVDLAGYRNRYALYKTDPDLQALHAVAPCLMTWDDHEVQNDYSNRWSQNVATSTADFLKRRAAAYRAFYEHMPLRRRSAPHGPDMRIYDRLRYGDLAEFTVLDGRQYRTIQPCALPDTRRGHVAPETCADLSDPSRTMLGAKQERWLYDGFRRADARWTMIVQDLLVAPLKQAGKDGLMGHFTDGWDGYEANRSRMLGALAASRAPNPVFLGGDIHSFWATDLKTDFDKAVAAPVASEFVAAAISQEGPPKTAFADAQRLNPHVRFVDLETNGYASLTLTHARIETRFQAISDRKNPKAAVRTLQRFAVEAGRPGVRLA